MRQLLAAILFAAGLIFGSAAQAQAPFPVQVESRPIANFRLGSSETRFGALEFAGGFEMRSSEGVFGQLSALRFLTPGRDFLGVADHGYWFSGRILRGDNGAPLGVGDFRMQAMADSRGRSLSSKRMADAEGLDVADGVATVSFEREARLVEYALDPTRVGSGGMADARRDIDFVIPRHELRNNQGLETVTRAPRAGPLAGARLVVAERSLDENGDIFAAIVEGPGKGIFKVRRSDGFDVTDGVFLADGDLILLERRLSLASGVAMRMRRIVGATVTAGALVDGEVLMQADLAYRIDNMEGLDAWTRADGATMLSVISDDNQSFLQRTLYLEFRLLP
jgi:hypothetical protein